MMCKVYLNCHVTFNFMSIREFYLASWSNMLIQPQ